MLNKVNRLKNQHLRLHETKFSPCLSKTRSHKHALTVKVKDTKPSFALNRRDKLKEPLLLRSSEETMSTQKLVRKNARTLMVQITKRSLKSMSCRRTNEFLRASNLKLQSQKSRQQMSSRIRQQLKVSTTLQWKEMAFRSPSILSGRQAFQMVLRINLKTILRSLLLFKIIHGHSR